MAFNDAMTDLTTGRIDYAVVGGASGIFRPQTSIAFQRLHMMSPDVSARRVLTPLPSTIALPSLEMQVAFAHFCA
jgi:3-oxoacyl-(acyl-carrier-protein) synthase